MSSSQQNECTGALLHLFLTHPDRVLYCSTADRHQSRCMREWKNITPGTALVPEVVVRIKGMYSISWFTNITLLMLLFINTF